MTVYVWVCQCHACSFKRSSLGLCQALSSVKTDFCPIYVIEGELLCIILPAIIV